MPKVELKRNTKPSVINNPSAPDLFADEAIGFLLTNNIMRITLASTKCDHATNPGTNRRTVAGRLVMPLSGAENLHRLLTKALESAKSGAFTANTEKPTMQ